MSVQIRLNDEEEELVLRAMVASGDTKTATHIKKVYFEAIQQNDLVANRVYQALELINHKIDKINNSKKGQSQPVDQDMTLTMLCAMYVMIRKSVNEPIRKSADELLDLTAIENYLKGEKNENN